MNYQLIKSTNKDIERLIEYKKRIILAQAKDLSKEEIEEINNYAKEEVLKNINNYSNIVIENQIVGCLLITDKEDGILLDEIYLEEEYQNQGIGTKIIKDLMNKNNTIYLWVYKDNEKAVSLYQKLGFIIVEETQSRFFMKFNE